MKNLFIISLILTAFAVNAFAQKGDPLPPFYPAVPVCTGTVPTSGTSEVQTFTISAVAAATIQFGFQGKTANLVLTGTEANTDIQTKAKAAIEGMATVGASNTNIVAAGTTTRTITVTFTGSKANLALPLMSSAVTAGSITISGTTTTDGITADGRNCPKGTILINKGTPALYYNTGTPPNPVWTKFSP